MSGEAKMTDPSIFLLLHQVLKDSVLGIKIGIDVHLTDIVEQVKIKVCNTAFF